MKSITHSDPGVNQTPSIALVPASVAVSPALAEANRQLLRLRDQHRTAQPARPLAVTAEKSTNSAENPPCLPSHLGWHTAAATPLYQRQNNCFRIVSKKYKPNQNQPQKLVTTPDEHLSIATTKAYPALLAAFQRSGLTAAGRVWLLCRFLDPDGRGWLAVHDLHLRLTKKTKNEQRKAQADSVDPKRPSFALFGRRRLRQILQQGRGIFWERDAQDRLWLYGAARVATHLGVAQLRSKPVLLPLNALTATLATARAHFYAAFHSGRSAARHDGHAAPISRATLERVTHVPERTQRAYDQVAGVKRRSTFALGRRHSAENAQEIAWQRGAGTFAFIDHHGQQGQAGTAYVAWRLPNTYRGVHVRAARGRHKKINQKLAFRQAKATNNDSDCNDLVKTRERGNDVDCRWYGQQRRQVHGSEPMIERLFYVNARRATMAKTTAYWQQTATKRYHVWHYISRR
ncbi:MAG: hypothetical protein M9941_11180 [Anaerolineae bacterium]|nr:hypothetical protein [Anaerolineae bacterium]